VIDVSAEQDDSRAPSEAELTSYLDSLSNWGRWGDDLAGLSGTLNLINPDLIARAASGVVSGRVVSCGLPIPFAGNDEGRDGAGHLIPGDNEYPIHYMLSYQSLSEQITERPKLRSAAHDGFLMEPHGRLITHIDAPIHTVLDGTMFNGVEVAGALSEHGAIVGAIDLVSGGIAGRGVLLDVARSRGMPWLEDTDRVFPDDLERCASEQGVEIEPGDCVLVRTGYRARTLTGPKKGPGYRRPGLQAACLPWLRERDVAVISSDVPVDCFPFDYEIGLPIHTIGMWSIGLWIVDNCHLEELGGLCADSGRYDFLLAIAPLKLGRMSCSPVNPLAIF
jgi:kynurenine formamidase